MATADELLAGVIVVDKTLVVDNDFRTIKIPSSVPNLGVEHDDDVLQLDFKMPRYVSNTDLSGFSIRIKYINAKGEPDAYTVRNPIVGDQYITFNWLVGPTATRYKGNTNFIVCAKTLKADGTIDREFNTTIATLPVLEGLEVDESIVSEYSDLIEQWRQELFGIGDTEEASIKAVSQTEQEAIEAKGAEVLATIPPEYTETYEAAQESIRTKADAIIGNEQGETIAVSDSSDDHVRGLKLFGKTTQVTTTGKQLIKVTKTSSTTNGITYTVNTDGSVHVRGTATGNTYFIIDSNNPISIRGSELIAAISGSDKVYMTIGYFKDDSTIVNEVAYALGNASCSFTYPSEAVTTRTFLGVNTGVTVDAVVYPMIRLATIEDSSYEPYSGGVTSPSPEWPQELNSVKNPTVDICGGNLFNFDGITDKPSITRNSDGSLTITAYSAPTGYTLRKLAPSLKAGHKYTLYVDSNSSNKIIYLLETTTTWASGRTMTVTDADLDSKVYVYGVKGDTPIIIRNIAIVPKDIVYDGGSFVIPQTLSVDRTIQGIPVTTGGNYTDANGQQWVCDEVDFERGVYIQRVYALVSDYNSGWKISGNSTTNHNAFYRMNTELPTMIKGTNKPVVCTHFTMTRDPVADHVTCVSGGLSNQEVYFFVPKTDFPDVETWTNYVVEQANAGTPITTYYILNEPIETPLTAEEIAAFKALRTNYHNTTVLNDAGATMELTYNADTKTWVKNHIFDMLKGDIETALDSIIAIQNELIGGDGV